MPVKKDKRKTAYIVTVDMGYGHQRATHPLRIFAEGEIISANVYQGIPEHDKRKWERSRRVYEILSRMKHLPLVGNYFFGILDRLQRIEPFYPIRDLSDPILQLREIYKLIKKDWGKHLIDKLNEKPLPLITSFFVPAFFAEEHKYKEDIYCLCTDTDISRAWAPLYPQKSRIKYLAPNKRVRERLKSYGVRSENIFVTGFPLPTENLGSKDWEILRGDLGCRISNLDPLGKYQKKYKATIREYLGVQFCDAKRKRPLTITFAVGGAGAQRELGAVIMESLRHHLIQRKIRLVLAAGNRKDVYDFFEEAAKEFSLKNKVNGAIKIIYSKDKSTYFEKFNEVLRNTDVLWTKPSELSFYTGLGLPIIMAPTIGSQEDFNKEWLTIIGSGVMQEDPKYTSQWLFDWLNSGWLAEAAMEGFLDAPKNGVYHIEDVVLHKKRSEIEEIHLI